MADIEFAEIIKVPMNQLWQHEAMHFTPWLAQNIQKLGDALGGLQLEVEQIEISTGNFRLDILARDLNTNKNVVIENQIYKTDNKHLGQLITYASYFKADIIIWISQEILEEHRSAFDWLNTNTHENLEFYAVEVDIIKIENSKPALNFKLRAFPNGWQKGANKIIDSSSSETGELYRAFFQELLTDLRENHRFTNARAGQPQSWYNFATGIKGLKGFMYAASFARGGKLRAELYIDTPDAEANKQILREFESLQAELNSEFGEILEFEELPTKRASRIAVYRAGVIDDDTQSVEEMKHWFVDRLLKFKSVFGSRLLRFV